MSKAKTIGVYLDADLADVIIKKAKAMHISTSKYCGVLLQRHVDSKEVMVIRGDADAK